MKIISGLMLAACLPVAVLAAGNITLGGGLNLSYTTADAEGAEYSPRVGFNAGVGYQIPAGANLAVSPEINLETRGENAESEDGGDAEAHLKMLYLQIPVFFIVKPAPTSNFSFFGGPVLGIPLAGEIEGEEDDVSVSIDIKDDLSSPEFGLELGVGLEFPRANGGAFFIRPSYYHALTDYAEDAEQNRNFKIKVGIRL